jgi:hypothetical protein
MTTTALKKKIYEYIDSTDEKMLQVVYTILEEHIKLKEEEAHQLTIEDIKALDRRWEAYKKGDQNVYTIEEAKKDIRKKLRSIKH